MRLLGLCSTRPFGCSATQLTAAVTLILFCLPIASSQTNTTRWSETTLYHFKSRFVGEGDQAITPGPGGLYGKSIGDGLNGSSSIFELSPPGAVGHQWSVAALYSFESPDGDDGAAGLLVTRGGVLFGVTKHTVFQLNLTPTPTLTVLHAFAGPDGDRPNGPLVSDANGNLYGTAQAGGQSGYGLVYELAPPSSPGGHWTQTILHTFTGPDGDSGSPKAALLMDTKGVLYGTTEATVFRLAPPSRPDGYWTETVLWDFKAQGGGSKPETQLIIDDVGNLYGTTTEGGAGYGVVYRLSPPNAGATVWTETVLHSFTAGSDGAVPLAGLSWGSDSTIFGTTNHGSPGDSPCGTAFSLTPLESGLWRYSVLYNFQGQADGCSPNTKLAVTPNGELFGTTAGGRGGLPVIFELHK